MIKPIYLYLSLLLISLNFSCQQNASTQGNSSVQQNSSTQEQTSPAVSTVLDKTAINEVFTNTLKSSLGINYPLRKGYYNKDKSGEFYILITESFDGIGEEKDTLSRNIKILKIAKHGSEFINIAEINDHVNEHENSIWVWTKYCEFKDADQDGYIDPILVYGSSQPDNGIDAGRLKIITWYKGQKIVIRHQNGILDDERNTQVDAAFYKLPQVLQKSVRGIMKRLNEKTDIIFPYEWEKKMDKKRLKFDEINKY